MKKFISILLAILMVCITMVTAFAADDDSHEELITENYIQSSIKYYREYFIYYMGMMGYNPLPKWSESSSQNMQTVFGFVEEKLNENNISQDELNSLNDMVETAVDCMCIDSSELKWMLDYMEKDYNSTDYYDEATTAELKKIYEQALSAYNSGDENQIHISYVEMRNELNKLCLYNTIPGDIDRNGKLDIDDVTLMQKDLACITDFNSSQNFISDYFLNSDINRVTRWQMVLSDNFEDTGTKSVDSKIKKLSEVEILDADEKFQLFNLTTEQINEMYSYDRYYYAYISGDIC